MDHLAAIKQTFFQECDEQLADLESGLLRIEEGSYDSETVNAVFRCVHSIKGGAGAFGFDDLVDFVHIFESTLDLLRSQKLEATPAVTKLLLRASDILSDLVRACRNDETCENVAVDEAKRNLRALCEEHAGGESDDGDFGNQFMPVSISFDSIFGMEVAEDLRKSYRIFFKPHASLYAKANEALRILRELHALGECVVTCNIDDLPMLPDLDPEGAYFSWIVEIKTSNSESDIRQVFEFVESDCDLTIEEVASPDEAEVIDAPQDFEMPLEGTPGDGAAAAPAVTEQPRAMDSVADPGEAKARTQDRNAASPQATIRVDLEKVDRLINLVGELVINQAVLSQRVSEAGLSRASSVVIGLEELEQLTRDIQDSVMAIRAQPLKPIFQRMSRIVRETATLTNKSVRLIFDGESTEVDKTVIERLTDPLTHMVRNAVDHGIESPDERQAAGKPEEGTLRLSASHRSGRIVIEVADDGAGINRSRVKEIAIAKGLIAPDAILSDEEVDGLIFLPGFSTNATASSISGRGVGMDVVRRAIQALGGRISTASRYGHGSTFSMSLPLTLAVLDGMVVTVAGQTLIVPLSAIIETLQPKTESVHSLGAGARVISCRSAFIPLIDVGSILRYRGEEVDPTMQVALLVESQSGGKCALLVDAIQGQRQVVIKSLEENYGPVQGVAAATILGDGRVALIIDVDAIMSLLRGDASSPSGVMVAAE